MVNRLRMFYTDASAAFDCSGWFSVYEIATRSIIAERQVSSSGSSGNVNYADSSDFSQTIDNTKYAYLINWRPVVADSSMQLLGFQLSYTPPPGRATVIPLY